MPFCTWKTMFIPFKIVISNYFILKHSFCHRIVYSMTGKINTTNIVTTIRIFNKEVITFQLFLN